MPTTTRRPFRFGVQISAARPPAAWKEQARKAEALGYDVFLMPDHFGGQFAIGPALAVVAEATTTLRIGTLTWQNDLRHPALAAKEAATLDVLSEGRFELGIGAGGSFPPEFDWTGIPFDQPGQRVGRLEEAIAAFKGVMAPEPYAAAGTHYTFNAYNGFPKPVQQPHPPILIGAGGKRMLTLAAREADIVSILPGMSRAGGVIDEEEVGPEGFDIKIELLRREAGGRFEHLELNVLIQAAIVTDDRAAALDRLRAERGMTNDVWFRSPMVYVGSVDSIVNEMRAARERFGITYFALFEPQMEAFAPVVAALAGKTA